MLCNNITGVCSCKPHVIGDTCDTCEPGYYLAEPDTCSPCNCDLGGALSNVCDIYTGECTCRTGVTGLTCSEPAENRFFPYIDHFLFEAEESLGVTNFSYRTQSSLDLFTGSGYALINNDVDIINFGSFTPPISGEYDIVIRYNLKNTFVWEEAELRVTVGNEEGDGTPATCVEYSNEEIIYSDWTMGVGQAVFNTICLRGGRSYSLVLNGFIPGSDTAELEIDSMVILLKEPEGLSTFVNPIIQSQYSQCITNFRALATRDNSLNGCRDVSFSVFTELYNGTLGMSLYVYVCMYVYIYIYIYIYICMSVCIYYVYVCMYVRRYMCVYTTCMHMYGCIHTHIIMYLQIYGSMYMY